MSLKCTLTLLSAVSKTLFDIRKVVGIKFLFESLILAQDKRWRRALGMQVERSDPARASDSGRRVSNGKVSTSK